jgi:Big-like domain-containing protein/purple acid phosphatase-like protein
MSARNRARFGACAGLVLILVIASQVSESGISARAGEAQQAPSAPTSLRILGPGSDTTPPVISLITTSSITSSGARIGWTTNEASDSQVIYGPTTAYGSTSPLNASLVTTHTVTLSGLAPNTLYHFRVRSSDATGNLGMGADTTFTTSGTAQVSIAPQDTSINLNTTNFSGDTTLTTYTWPDNQVANAVLMKFDFSSLPAGAVVQQAALHVALVQADTFPETTYVVTANKVIAKNPVIATMTGYTADGVTAWTPNSCCSGNVPLAQADISSPYDTQAITKAAGDKSWTITTMVQEWLADPASNRGLLLNSDASKLRDRYRYFASMEHADPTLRPYLSITYSVVPDGTPPVISAVTTSSITSSGATINWTTNEASDSRVDYGTTTAYGSMTTLNSTLVTSHATPLTGLTSGTLYHYRVRSKDPAGNLAVSGDFTFTTTAVDGVPPSTAITAPAAGATVSNSITVSASASDNVGVVGVRFKLDGADLGAEDMSAPYSISWSTTTAANGSHALTATARDAAGNQTTSTAVSVTVSNSGSAGIAALYPGDVGIESHSAVVFVERFDEPTLTALLNRWTQNHNGADMSFSPDVPAGSPVGRSLNIPWTGGGVSDGGHLYLKLTPGVDDTLYVRYYIKYPTTGNYHHDGIWFGGYNPPLNWPFPQAGVKPAGNDRFAASAEQTDNHSKFDHYDYWMNMRSASDGKYWGNSLLNSPNVTVTEGQWTCIEHMVKLNNPVTAFNGEHAIWINGVKVSHLGQGYPNGTWSGITFTQTPSGAPFEGFRWRSDPNLNINYIWLQNYSDSDPAGFTSSIKFAHVVAARSYIGCLQP